MGLGQSRAMCKRAKTAVGQLQVSQQPLRPGGLKPFGWSSRWGGGARAWRLHLLHVNLCDLSPTIDDVRLDVDDNLALLLLAALQRLEEGDACCRPKVVPPNQYRPEAWLELHGVGDGAKAELPRFVVAHIQVDD